MIDLLRKKISGFVDKLSGKGPESEKKEAAPEEELVVEKEVEAQFEEEEPEISVSPENEEIVAGEEPEIETFEEKAGAPQKKETEKVEILEEKKPEEKKEKPVQIEIKHVRGEERPVEKAAPPLKKEIPLKIEAPKKAVEVKEEPTPLRKEKEVWAAPKAAEPEKKPVAPAQISKPIPPQISKPAPEVEVKPEIRVQEKPVQAAPKPAPPKPIIPLVEKKEARREEDLEEREAERKKELDKKVKKSIFAAVAETITGESQIKEEEIAELLDELELGMLESDVALSVAEEIKVELQKRIVGAKVKRGQTAVFVRDNLQEILINMFNESPGFDLVEKLRGMQKPVKIMVMGPNGSGKTTSIAKIAYLLQQNGFRVCIAAADTFRAAAVEQMVHHGKKLGINVVHGAYGADPASIAFDAVNHAKTHGMDIVLIDTAGRQETNVNLLNQLKKMDRVIAPELKIYVGESIAGNAMVEQISAFHNEIKLDGVVLTKLDCDAKGGTVVSVTRVTGLPILYVGTGQGYGDIERFDAEKIVGEILS